MSGSAGPIFAIFSPNESIFGADDRSVPLRVARSLDQKNRTKFLRTNKFNVVLFI